MTWVLSCLILYDFVTIKVMGMSEFFTAISNFGFPVVVAGYLLIRIEGRVEKLTLTINDLKNTIDDLKNEIARKRR